MREAAEWIEREALLDLGAARPAARGALLVTEKVGPALAISCPGVDHPLLNRVLGLGEEPRTSELELDVLLEHYRRAGSARFFVHLYDDAAPAELPEWLAARGVVRYRRSWHKLGRGRSERLPSVTTAFTVRTAREADTDAVLALFAEGFDLPPAGARVFASALGRPRWHCHVATDADEFVVGAGLAFVAGGVGYLAGGATRSSARGGGVQLALLTERCRAALDLGCHSIVSETGEPAPGDPQHSHHNLERCGLSVFAVRHNYAPGGTLWQHGSRQ